MLNFWHKIADSAPKTEEDTTSKIKVVVVSFDDNCARNCGKILYRQLSLINEIEAVYYEDTEPKSFLNLQQGNFFDLIDTGNLILKKTQADVLIWGLRQGNEIRINFQKKRHYAHFELPFFSLLNSLYLPLNYFQQGEIPPTALTLISAGLFALCKDVNNLHKSVEKISQSAPPPGLTEKQMPYILQMLGVLYIHDKAANLNKQDIALILQLQRNCYEQARKVKDSILFGCFYAQIAQFYSLLSNQENMEKFANLRKAIESLRYARKYFNRYNFPYDFGFQSYQLSENYFEFWRQTNDIQALRDAVFYLRDAEKIFTMISFPSAWAEIQKDLGYYLSLLGSYGKNDEILMLAIDNYKNRQRVFTKEADSLMWAQCEECIGNILYTIGKMHANVDYLQESIHCYANAADVYENLKMSVDLRQMRVCQSKSEEQIMRLQNK